jgi:hypothetical protein
MVNPWVKGSASESTKGSWAVAMVVAIRGHCPGPRAVSRGRALPPRCPRDYAPACALAPVPALARERQVADLSQTSRGSRYGKVPLHRQRCGLDRCPVRPR